MEKHNAIEQFLMNLELEQIIPLHNAYCEQNHYDALIYPMTEDIINSLFKTPFDLIKALHKSNPLENNDYYFCYINEEFQDVYDVIDWDNLAEYLIEWGDSKFNFDLTDHLVDAFKKYAYNQLNGYSKTKIAKIVDALPNDFLMEEWENILEEFDKVVAVCECGNIIYTDDKGEYNYDNGKTAYTCPLCEEKIYI